jgi:aromatic-L-amino-acid decarboxylase
VTFLDDGAAALEWAARYLERVGELPVLSQVEPGDVRSRLAASPPEQGEPFSAVLRDLEEVVLPGITHWNHPRFFGYFAISGSEPGILAELLVAALNVNAMLWRTSPAATELEELALDWAAQLLGLPRDWHGHIEDTASTATVAALAAARDATGRRVAVFSEESNLAIEKAARLVGLTPRRAPVDEALRLRPDAVDLADAAAVVATVGTTSSGSIDPVRALAERCAAAGAWLHVDAAWAGSAAVCPEHRSILDGCELADSFCFNPHKWLLTPIDCSCLYTSRPDDFRRTFSLIPDYLRPPDGQGTNLMEYGPALGRRFRGLKLWAVLRAYGREGLQRVVREHVRLAELFEAWVREEPGWELAVPRTLALVCFRREGSDEENRALLDRVNASGEAFLTSTVLHGQLVLRLAIGNLRTTEDDVRRTWEALRVAAEGGRITREG